MLIQLFIKLLQNFQVNFHTFISNLVNIQYILYFVNSTFIPSERYAQIDINVYTDSQLKNSIHLMIMYKTSMYRTFFTKEKYTVIFL